MATFTQKKVSFAHDDPDLMKPKPDKIAEYEKDSAELILKIKTAQEMEEEINNAFASLKTSSNAWRPRRKSIEDDYIEAINELVMQSEKMLVC